MAQDGRDGDGVDAGGLTARFAGGGFPDARAAGLRSRRRRALEGRDMRDGDAGVDEKRGFAGAGRGSDGR